MLDVNFGNERIQLPRPAPLENTMGGGFIGGYIPGILRYHRVFFESLQNRKHEFIGKEQPQMYRACFLEENLCLMVKHSKRYLIGNAWFFMAPFMILGAERTHGRTWMASIDNTGQLYKDVLEPPKP